MKRVIRAQSGRLILTAAFAGWASRCLAGGIPEPGLVIYGVVSDSSARGARVTSGTLQWTVRPLSGGSSITVSSALEDINGQYSYRVGIPFETLVGSTALSLGALETKGASATYNLLRVDVDGVEAQIVTGGSTFTLKFADRGVIERVDLAVDLSGENGGNNVDSDGDGLTDAQEAHAGTDPNDPADFLHFTSIRTDAGQGVLLQWSSAAGRTYVLQRATELGADDESFSTVGSGIPATPPLNTFYDDEATGEGPYFYRLAVP